MRTRLTRRRLLGTTAAGLALAGTGLPRLARSAEKTVKIGFLAPMSGDYVDWGLPGLYGCEIWAENVNAQGGLKIGEDNYQIEFVGYDDEAETDKALQGAKKLVLEDGVKFVLMLGGNYSGVQQFFNDEKMMASTLLPSDMSPEAPYLIAPAEVHPFYNVTGVDWLKENRPELKTAVICAQDDSLGRPSVATYKAAFRAAGIEVKDTVFFDIATSDFAPVMTSMLQHQPDLVCLDTAYADFVHPLCEQAFQQGFKGTMISCTADYYQKIIEKTSAEFMEGFIFQFPDFDDPALNEPEINFPKPNEFYAEYVKRYGADECSAVSWEYASIMDLSADAAQKARTIEPAALLTAMKEGGKGKHAFGEADWWGEELFGIDNALVGNWPVVVIENGKAVIKEYRSIPAWWEKHKDLLVKHMTDLGQMYHQRG